MSKEVNTINANFNFFRVQYSKRGNKVYDTIRLINSTNVKRPSNTHKLKNRLYNWFSTLIRVIKNTDKTVNVETRVKPSSRNMVKKFEIGEIRSQGTINANTVVEKTSVNIAHLTKHFDELLTNAPDVLLVLASDNSFLENNFPRYFSHPKIKQYGEYIVSSFPCALSENKLGYLDIDNRTVCIAKNGKSVSMRVVHATNWSETVIEKNDRNEISNYADKVGDEKAKIRAKSELYQSHNGVSLLHFNDEYAANLIGTRLNG